MLPKQHIEEKNIFAILSNKFRKRIIQLLSEEPLTFTELSRNLNISSSKLNFHLRKMKDLTEKIGGKYHLNKTGRTIHTFLKTLTISHVPENQAKIASVGMLLVPNDIDFNIREALKSIDIVSAQGIDLVCLPFINMSKPYSLQKIITPFLKKAEDLQTYVTFGLFELKDDNNYYSTALVTPYDNFEIYRSTHRDLFTSKKIDTGNKITVVDTKIGKIGLACGIEYLYPELFRILRLKGADYAVCPAFGLQEKFRNIVQYILVTRAIENQMIVVFSSSSYFQKEPFGVICSINEEVPFSVNTESVNVSNISMIDIRKNREYFERFFPRRTDLYKELTKMDENMSNMAFSFPATTTMFPMKRIVKKYKVQSAEFVQYEETTTFEKPLHVNIPMTGYIQGIIPMKEVKDIKWFDDLGTLDGVITNKGQLVQFLAPDRFVLIPGRSCSIGFRCKTSDPIKAEGNAVSLNLSFEDYNKLLTLTGCGIDEFEVEVIVGSKFELIKSTPVYDSMNISNKTMILNWRWRKPRKLPPLKIRLKKRTDLNGSK